MAIDKARNAHSQHLLWELLRDHPAHKLATFVGVSAASLYAASEGLRTIPVHWLTGLSLATKDPGTVYGKLAGADDAGLLVLPRQRAIASAKDLKSSALTLAGAVGKACDTVDRITADDVVTPAELIELREELNRLQTKVAETVARVQRAGLVTG